MWLSPAMGITSPYKLLLMAYSVCAQMHTILSHPHEYCLFMLFSCFCFFVCFCHMTPYRKILKSSQSSLSSKTVYCSVLRPCIILKEKKCNKSVSIRFCTDPIYCIGSFLHCAAAASMAFGDQCVELCEQERLLVHFRGIVLLCDTLPVCPVFLCSLSIFLLGVRQPFHLGLSLTVPSASSLRSLNFSTWCF